MTISELYKKIANPKNITIDTRNLKKGDIFWALKGEKFDGNLFAEEALKKGASLVISDSTKNTGNPKIIFVKDTLRALQELARHHRRMLNIPVLAITGSNGKTTTKELSASVLKKKYKTVATKGNFNNHIGLPLTLLSFDNTTEIGIVEMGANHEGEINQLCQIAEPDYGLITNIGKAHLEGFGSFEGVVRAKTEMYRYLKDKQIFINSDNPLLTEHSKGIQTHSYGTEPDADICGKIINELPFLKISISKPKAFTVNTNLSGRYNFENVLAAIAIGLKFEVPEKLISEALNEYRPKNNRSQVFNVGNTQILLDAYNANPSSITAATENLFRSKKKNLAIFLGDMFELGTYSQNEHQNVIANIKEKAAQYPIKQVLAFLTGPEFMEAVKNNETESTPQNLRLFSFKDKQTTCDSLKKLNFKNAQILIKGSRGMAMEELLPCLKKQIQ
jgi:UDP-N-acetylmuramoyl-tripeptide--D-alanyl-D-alanine ligase